MFNFFLVLFVCAAIFDWPMSLHVAAVLWIVARISDYESVLVT